MNDEEKEKLYQELIAKLGDGIKNFKGYIEFVDDELYPSMGQIFGSKVMKDLDRFTNESKTYPEVIDKLKKKHRLTQFQVGVLLGHFMTIQSIRSGMNVV
jgi:hypothetical protein